jgi:peroxiredoxin (alkyl hydroperoxide reductase subunit C)
LKAYQDDVAKFDAMETQILGISVDSPFANKRFAEDLGVTYPLLSDFHRTVSRRYGVLDEERGVARRTTFVIDKEGIIRHIEQGASAIDPSGARQACSILSGKKERE